LTPNDHEVTKEKKHPPETPPNDHRDIAAMLGPLKCPPLMFSGRDSVATTSGECC